MSARGQIRNRERATQVHDFRGLRWGAITPTDVDAFVEFDDRLYVLVEYKGGGASMHEGQRLAFERSVRCIEATGRTAALLVARHSTPADRDVDCARCFVDQVYHAGRYWPVRERFTVRQGIDRLRARAGL